MVLSAIQTLSSFSITLHFSIFWSINVCTRVGNFMIANQLQPTIMIGSSHPLVARCVAQLQMHLFIFPNFKYIFNFILKFEANFHSKKAEILPSI